MVKCFYCDEEVEMLPFKCNYCGNFYCKNHRLPEKHECSFTLTKISTARKGINRPLTYNTNKNNMRISRRNSTSSGISGALLLLIISFAMFILTFIIRFELLYLSLYNFILPSFWYHTILTAMFIPPFSDYYFSIFSMIFYVILIYFLGRTIESRFSRNTFLKIYFLGSLITGGTILLLQIIFSFSNSSEIYFYSSSQGGIMALVAFVARNTPEREITLYLYLIPVRLKMKHLLWIYIGFQAINLIGSFDPVQPIANIMGLFGGIIILNSLRGPKQVFSPY